MTGRIISIGVVVILVVIAFLLGRGVRSDSSEAEYPTFGGYVGITNGDCDQLTAFLEDNVGRVVFIQTFLDLSVSMADQMEFEDRHQVLDFLEDSRLSLPLSDNGGIRLEIEFVGGRIPSTSHGGTGIVMAEFVGYFRVSQFARSGPSIVYHLREIPEVVAVSPSPR